jgi:short-chain Z-isoprenyl diphosphate synthase
MSVQTRAASAYFRSRAYEFPTQARGGGPDSFVLRPLYRFYERHLLTQIGEYQLPRHVAIILDGNRRHARALGVSDPQDIYDLGAQRLDDVLLWCRELQIPAVTVWVFSPENLKRSAEEVTAIFAAIEAKLYSLASDYSIRDGQVRVQAIGKLSLLPSSTRAVIRAVEEATAHHTGMVLNIAIGYGGRQEIADAVVKFLADSLAKGIPPEDIIARVTPEAIGSHLYTSGLPDPDLIIRTSGEVRLSGFLLWQSVHSEFYFTDVNWPAFRKIDFLRAIRAYQQRQRRFGL